MKLNEKFEIIERPHGYEMRQKVRVKDFKTQEMKDGISRTFYGTMDQALIGFVNHSIKDPKTLDELKVKVMSIRDLIVSLKAEIKAERGVIRSVKP